MLKTKDKIFFRNNDKLIEKKVVAMYQEIILEHEGLINNGSGWYLTNLVDSLEIAVNQYNPLKFGSYTQVEPKLEKSNCLINVKNEDDFCFKYDLLKTKNKGL